MRLGLAELIHVKGVNGSDLLRAIIISMLPPKGHEDFARHRHLWKALDELERYLISLIPDRSRIKGATGPSLMLVDIAEANEIGEEEDAETGDAVVYRIEMKRLGGAN